MADKSKIQWTDATWNPVTGCTKVSEGCRNCYAMGVAFRNEAMGSAKYKGVTVKRMGHAEWSGKINLHPDTLEIPLHWKKPRMIFVNSMSDLFHESIPDSFILQVFEVMEKASWHIFQVLTKRPERMLEWITAYRFYEKPLPNVWLGVSVEDQKTADERIPILLQTPSAIHWISAEPLLGIIDLTVVNEKIGRSGKGCRGGIDWCVVGGESGSHARPMHPEWVKHLQRQCESMHTPFFFKQWGEYLPLFTDEQCRELSWKGGKHQFDDGTITIRVGKKKAGRLLNGREYNEMPTTGGHHG